MSNVTLRFFHLQSHTPVFELEASEISTVGALHVALLARLATEDVCPMRVISKWHAEIVAGGRKRRIELTDEDSEMPLTSIGIAHLGEIFLEGPLIGESVGGVGQAVALVGAQLHQLRAEASVTNSLLRDINSSIKGQQSQIVQSLSAIGKSINAIVSGFEQNRQLDRLPDEAFAVRNGVYKEEQQTIERLQFMKEAEGVMLRLKLKSDSDFGQIITCFGGRVFDHRALNENQITISADGKAATLNSEGWATAWSSQPLSPLFHKWSVLIEAGKTTGLSLGLLRNVSGQESKMKIKVTGGWAVRGNGEIEGNWKCPPFVLSVGDLVVFDYNFVAKTLTISCNGRREVVGHIPSIQDFDVLYPTVSFYYPGTRVRFIN